MIIDLLRHGALQGGVKYRGRVEADLTPQGRAQMDAVWRQLADDVDVVVTSPLSRCAQAAQIWAKEKGIACVVDDRVAEMHYGAWENKTHDEIEAAFPGMLKKWRQDPTGMRPPGGGESPEELRQRIQDFWQDRTTQTQYKHPLVVGHSGSLRMLIACIEGKPIAYTRQIPMPYACWSRAEHVQGESRMIFVNKCTEVSLK